MVTMMKDNVYRIVTPSGVAELERLGFIVCGEGGGKQTPPPVHAQEEAKKEPVNIVDTSIGDALMYGKIHLSQVSNIVDLRRALTQYGVPVSENDNKATLIKKRNDFIDSVKGSEGNKKGRPTNRSKPAPKRKRVSK